MKAENINFYADLDAKWVKDPGPKVTEKGMEYARSQMAELEYSYKEFMKSLNNGSTLEEYYDWEMACSGFDADLCGFGTILQTGRDAYGYVSHIEGAYENE
ncbi:hypothetical protein [Salmonella phage SSBI34]|nr:hypothetical protein [Salmonella phage SSBI34]